MYETSVHLQPPPHREACLRHHDPKGVFRLRVELFVFARQQASSLSAKDILFSLVAKFALGRERKILGRIAYSKEVRIIVLADSCPVALVVFAGSPDGRKEL